MSIYILLGSTFFITLIDYVCALVGNVLITKKLSVFDYGIYNFLNSISGLILTFFLLAYHSIIIKLCLDVICTSRINL